MPQTAVKLVWSMSACNFCPRSDVRTCQIKPGKFLSKLSSALEVEESALENCDGICTCCLADVDMIIRAVAIRGAMKDYFQDTARNKSCDSDISLNTYFNGHYQQKAAMKVEDKSFTEQPSFSINPTPLPGVVSTPDPPAPPLPVLVAKPSFVKNARNVMEVSPEILSISSASATPTPTKKSKERLTRYQCMLCNKIAGSKSHCMEHLICHSPVRPFTCSHCMKTYKSRKACREHLIVMHGVEKNEESLQSLVLVDVDGLKQLEHVCTQYRKMVNPAMPKAAPELIVTPLPKFKMETEESRAEPDCGSAWLYKPEISPQLPPPLLQCVGLPSVTPSSSAFLTNPTAPYYDETPLPSKRTRKGTPHKLIHESVPEELPLESFEVEPSSNVNEDSGCISILPDNTKSTTTMGSSSNVDLGQGSNCNVDLNRSYFPSFQAYKTEPPFVWASKQSPPGGSKRPQTPCEVCGRSFPTKEKMADHMRSHSEVKQFSCLVCNKFFKYRRGVTNHLKEVHHLTDRLEINSKVTSHEIGFIVKKSSRSKRKSTKYKIMDSEIVHQTGTNISQKVIQDTLSSLAEIQHAADSTPIMPMLSSDESVGSVTPRVSPFVDNPTPDNSMHSVEDEINSTDGNLSPSNPKTDQTEVASHTPNQITESHTLHAGDDMEDNLATPTFQLPTAAASSAVCFQ